MKQSTKAACVALDLLRANKIDRTFRVAAWSLHDAIVNHDEKVVVTQVEAREIILTMSRHFPLMLTRRAHYHCAEQNHAIEDGPNATEFEFFALVQDEETYVWCSVYVPDDPEYNVCETCIADEITSELPYHIDCYL